MSETSYRYLKRRIAASPIVMIWGALLWLGVSICRGAAAQGVVGLPNNGQIMLYVVIPAIMFSLGLAIMTFAGRISLELYVATVTAMAVVFVPVLLLFGGGV